MSDWRGLAESLADVVTEAPEWLTVASAEASASKGWYWPISGDTTTILKAEDGKSDV